MSLSFAQMQALCKEIASSLISKTLTGLFEGPERYFHFIFNTQNQLLICLQMPFLRFHLESGNAKQSSGPFVQELEKQLKGCLLTNFALLDNDRILELTFDKRSDLYYLVAELIPKRPNLYLLKQNRQILLSLNPTILTEYAPPQHIKNVHFENELIGSSKEIAALYIEKEKQFTFDKLQQELRKEIDQQLKQARRQLEKAKKNLEGCENWKQMHHEAELLQSQLYLLRKGMSRAEVPDWTNDNKIITIPLDPLTEPKIEAEKRFNRSKKLRAGIPHWTQLTLKAEKELRSYEERLNRIESCTTIDELKLLSQPSSGKKNKSSESAVSLPYREFTSSHGVPIWVGKNAKSNDLMTFKHAKGSDWWLHVNDYAGSHVILRTNKGERPDEQSLQEAMLLALIYSKAKDLGEADICITQCKYVVKAGKQAAGKVNISKHTVRRVRYDAATHRRLTGKADLTNLD